MILAFDTSNYTTSICLVEKGQVVEEWRTLVKVKVGDQGIRQSDAFFQHTQVLQQWVKDHLGRYGPHLSGVAVSTRPRPLMDSYMPVFRAGYLVASSIAYAKGIPLIETSHQEGHLAAALASCPSGITLNSKEDTLLFLHLSGGTTELHRVHRIGQSMDMTCLYETADISLGQLVDRIGVASGLAFPCGAEMDKLAVKGPEKNPLPSFKVKPRFNLSGYENYYKGLLLKYPDHPEWVYYDLFNGIQKWLSQLIKEACDQTRIDRVLLAGGVAASQQVRQGLHTHKALKDVAIHFSDPHYASDNAFGVGVIGELNIGRQ